MRERCVLIILMLLMGSIPFFFVDAGVSLVLSRPPVRGNVIVVDINGNGDYTSIQEASDNANEGDTIQVWNGTYNEILNIRTSVNIIGNGSQSRIITNIQQYPMQITSNMHISGLNLTNNLLGGACIYIPYRNSISIDNCIMNGWYGLVCRDAKGLLIEDNMFYECETSIRFGGSCSAIVNGNIFGNGDSWGVLEVENTGLWMDDNIFINHSIQVHFQKYQNMRYYEISSTNTINSVPILFIKNSSSIEIGDIYSQMFFYGCSDIVIHGSIMEYVASGMVFYDCDDITIRNSSFKSTSSGASITGSVMAEKCNSVTLDNVYINYGNQVYLPSGSEFCFTNSSLIHTSLDIRECPRSLIMNNLIDRSFISIYSGDCLFQQNLCNDIRLEIGESEMMEIYNNNFKGKLNYQMITISDSNYQIMNNIIENASTGINLMGNHNGSIKDTTILSCDKGINTNDMDLIIDNLTVMDSKVGIIAFQCKSLSNSNFIGNNDSGLVLNKTSNMIITDNVFSGNNIGIHCVESQMCRIFNNWFENNDLHVLSIDSNNIWSKVPPVGGNYWDDYTGKDRKRGNAQDEDGSDGFGDVPYNISSNDRDRYPIMRDLIAPTANLDDITMNESEEIILTTIGSSDDNMIMNAKWRFLIDDIMINRTGLSTEFTIDRPCSVIVELNVSDFAGNFDTAEATITVKDILIPWAISQGDLIIDENTWTTFNGSASWDTGEISGYEWEFEYKGENHILSGIEASFFFDVPGIVPVTLRVTDAVGHVGADLFNVTIRDLTSPVAIAGDDIEIENGEEALFDGSLCSDNGIIRYYNWTFSYDKTLISLTGITTRHIFEIPGYYDVTLRVEDEFGNYAEDMLKVVVVDTIPPVPKISGRTKLFENEMLELNGYDSTDNGKIIRYVWTFVDDEPVEIEGPTLSYQFKIMSDHEVFLTVYDEWNNSATTSVLVEIADQTAPKANAGPDQKVAVGSSVILNGSLSTDNGIISRYTWAFTYQGEKKTLEGEVVSFKFDEAGEYQIILSVFDLADNYGDDKVVITVVGTGKLNGIVLDADGKPVPGATFEALASDGKTYTATTLSDGSFSLEIPEGSFSWKIMKDGYKPISGTGSIDALEDKDLDLSGSALEKEEGKSFPIMLVVIPAIIILLLIVGIVLFLVLRKKKEEPQEEIEKTEVEKEEPEPSPEASIPPEDSEFTQPPPIMEEEQPEEDPFKEEGSRDLRDLLEDDSVSG